LFWYVLLLVQLAVLGVSDGDHVQLYLPVLLEQSSMWTIVATGLLLLLLSPTFLLGQSARLFGVHPVVAASQRNKIVRSLFHSNVRGGASPSSTIVEDVDDDDVEEYDELEEEESMEGVLEIDEDEMEEEEGKQHGIAKTELSTLSASAVKAADKLKAKETASVKSALSFGIAATPTSNSAVSKGKSLTKFKLPYIVRACLNPIMFFTMTKGYWKSLFSLSYGKKVRLAASLVNWK
jgi:hypothetical protein